MPTTSDTIPQAIFLETDGGVAAVYADKAAAISAGWDLSWQDDTGAALASQPTWTLTPDALEDGRYVIGFTPPAGLWTVKVITPAGYRSDPSEFSGEASVYSIDDLYGIAASGLSTPVTELTTTGDVDLYDGNSIILDLTVLEAALVAIGAASLAALDAMSAKIKLTADNSSDPAEVDLGTPSILTDTSGNRVVQAELDAFPAALAIPDGQTEVACRCDLLITKGTKVITAATRNITVRWQANP